MSGHDPRDAALAVYAPTWAIVAIRTLDARLGELPGVLFRKAAPSTEDQALLHGVAAALDELVSLPPALRRLLWTDGPWAAGWHWDRALAEAWLAMSAGEHARDLDIDALRDRALARQTSELYDQLWRVPNWSSQPASAVQVAAAYTTLQAALHAVAPTHDDAALAAWMAADEAPGTAWGAVLAEAKRALIEEGVAAPPR